MQKIIEKESILKTRIMVSEDGSRTYSITKTLEGFLNSGMEEHNMIHYSHKTVI